MTDGGSASPRGCASTNSGYRNFCSTSLSFCECLCCPHVPLLLAMELRWQYALLRVPPLTLIDWQGRHTRFRCLTFNLAGLSNSPEYPIRRILHDAEQTDCRAFTMDYCTACTRIGKSCCPQVLASVAYAIEPPSCALGHQL